MAVKYDYEEMIKTIELLDELKEDVSQSDDYLNEQLDEKIDPFVLEYVKNNYQFDSLKEISSEIENNLNLYIEWIEEANENALQVSKGNITIAEQNTRDIETNNGGGKIQKRAITPTVQPVVPNENNDDDKPGQTLYGVFPAPNPKPTEPSIGQVLYGVFPVTNPEPTEPSIGQVLYGIFPVTNPEPTEPTLLQPLYGPFPSSNPKPIEPTIGQLLYGPFPVPNPEPTLLQPLYGPAPSSNPKPIEPTIGQLLYGPFPAPNPEPTLLQPLYGPFPSSHPEPTLLQPLYGPFPSSHPEPTLLQPLYGPFPSSHPEPTLLQPLYGPAPSEPEVIEQPVDPTPESYEQQPVYESSSYIEPYQESQYAETQNKEYMQQVATASSIPISSTENLEKMETENNTTTKAKQNTTDKTTTKRTNISVIQPSTKQKTEKVNDKETTSKKSIGIDKDMLIKGGGFAGAGLIAGGGVLLSKRMQTYTFTNEDWQDLDEQIQKNIVKTMLKARFNGNEIKTIQDSTFKIKASILDEHIDKLELAINTNPKINDVFMAVYNYPIFDGEEISEYLTFITTIIDGKKPNDNFNMYNILNKHLEKQDKIDVIYSGLNYEDYMEK